MRIESSMMRLVLGTICILLGGLTTFLVYPGYLSAGSGSMCPDDVIISNYQTTSPQFIDVTNVGNDMISLDDCSLVTFNVFTEESIGNGSATVALSGTLSGFETQQVSISGAPTGPGAFGIYNGPPPPDGTPFSTDNEITGMTYLDNDTVFAVGHLTVPAHNSIYDCIYGGHGNGPFPRPFRAVDLCLPNP